MAWIIFFLCLDDMLVDIYWSSPTPEINKLINDLGHDKYHARRDAHQKLKKLGFPALKGLRVATSHHNPEIAIRSREILNHYFNLRINCSIFCFDFESEVLMFDGQKRAILSKTQAKDYYMTTNDRYYSFYGHYIKSIAIESANSYIRELLFIGVKRDEVIRLIRESEERKEDLP